MKATRIFHRLVFFRAKIEGRTNYSLDKLSSQREDHGKADYEES
jgi:hypothetical protein